MTFCLHQRFTLWEQWSNGRTRGLHCGSSGLMVGRWRRDREDTRGLHCGSSGLMVGRWRRDGEVLGSNPTQTTGISLSKKFIPHLLLSTQVYKWVPVREISQCAVAANCAKMLTDDL
ncbi:hypothetical protein DPMN_190557 [Dreissena polymorpha]|uniref:Uncharacterized protein n=1 Tax=Dreissena polymorpha TaxID=45954 RepID=A0A9D4IDG0_DREPO|nr:hypothetical protein DPMN_190557 [Dreissena polymorpha]